MMMSFFLPPSIALLLSDPEKNPPNANKSPDAILSSVGDLDAAFTSGICV